MAQKTIAEKDVLLLKGFGFCASYEGRFELLLQSKTASRISEQLGRLFLSKMQCKHKYCNINMEINMFQLVS